MPELDHATYGILDLNDATRHAAALTLVELADGDTDGLRRVLAMLGLP